MNRSMLMVLLGTAILIPAEAHAQRARNAPSRVVAPEHSARLAYCRAPSDGRSYTCRSATNDRVVYRYAGPSRRVGARRRDVNVWIRPSWTHARIDFGWRGPRYGTVDQRQLRHMLGRRTMQRIRDHGRHAGLRGPVRGHWTRNARRDVLVVTMDGMEVARLVDRNRDGIVDVFHVRDFRRW